MPAKKRLLILSHCILNNASKVEQDESELQDEYIQRSKLLQLILKKDIQMLQLPCPEFILFGANRWGHVKDQFDYPYFRESCRKMLEPYILQIEEYLECENRFEILGVVTVEGSPSCGGKLTCRGKWGGEIGNDIVAVKRAMDSLTMVNELGVMMAELKNIFDTSNIRIPFLTLEEAVKTIDILS
jgi:predicted secreted protein